MGVCRCMAERSSPSLQGDHRRKPRPLFRRTPRTSPRNARSIRDLSRRQRRHPRWSALLGQSVAACLQRLGIQSSSWQRARRQVGADPFPHRYLDLTRPSTGHRRSRTYGRTRRMCRSAGCRPPHLSKSPSLRPYPPRRRTLVRGINDLSQRHHLGKRAAPHRLRYPTPSFSSSPCPNPTPPRPRIIRDPPIVCTEDVGAVLRSCPRTGHLQQIAPSLCGYFSRALSGRLVIGGRYEGLGGFRERVFPSIFWPFEQILCSRGVLDRSGLLHRSNADRRGGCSA